MGLAIGTNTSFLDRLYKDRQQCTLTCTGLQLAKQLDSQEDIVIVIVMEVVDMLSFTLLWSLHVCKVCPFTALFTTLYSMYAGT